MRRLTQEEISFFKREGYLFKRGVMDPALMARARERKWKGAPPRMKRDDPSTWFGPFRPDEEDEGPENRRLRYMWKYREPATEEWIIRMLATDPAIWGWVEQLLGKGEVKRPEKIRGIYWAILESVAKKPEFFNHELVTYLLTIPVPLFLGGNEGLSRKLGNQTVLFRSWGTRR